MTAPEHVHPLPLDLEYGGRPITITPTAVASDDGIVLVDVGPAASTDRLEEALENAGVSIDTIQTVLLTHHDGDHAGGLADLLDRLTHRPTVLAHPSEAPYIDGRRDPQKGGRYEPVTVDIEVVGGCRIGTAAGPLEIVETPGHTPGHVSAYLPAAGLLLAGDALVADDGKLAGPKPGFTADMDRATDSLEQLTRFTIEQICCYHGGMVTAGTSRIRQIRENQP